MTSLRSCSKIQRGVDFVAILLALAFVAGFAKPLVAADATAPDWLRAAAAEKLPDYPKDTVAAVILDDEQITINDKSEIQKRVRIAMRILRPEAEEDYGHAAVEFDSTTK